MLRGIGQPGDGLGEGRRILQHAELRLQLLVDLVEDSVGLLRSPSRGKSLRRLDDPLVQRAEQCRDAAGVRHLLVARCALRTEQHGGDGKDGAARSHRVARLLGESTCVDAGDGPPRRIQVGLRECELDVRAQLRGPIEELCLRRGELCRRIADEDEAVGEGKERKCCRRVARSEPTHAGRIDDCETVGQQRMRERDVDAFDTATVLGIAAFGHPFVQGTDVDLFDDDLVVDPTTDLHARLVAIAHEGDRGGGDVVVDRTHRSGEDCVDE